MPGFAKDEPRDYWQAADEHERVNGRLYVEVEFALPKELDKDEQITLAHDYAQALTEENHLPYTMALHEGHGTNPHGHLIISERINDGIEREAGDWFKRANSLEPEQGGAMKSREFHGGHTITEVRETWAEKANDALEKSNSLERIDHRSLEDQGIDRTPTQHIGRASWSMAERGIESDRFKELSALQERGQTLEREERHAERQVERELRSLTREAELEQGKSNDRGLESDHSGGAGADKQHDKQQDKGHERSHDYGLEL
jgi:hypothetical protein